jgi:ribonuclease BN (tRNA processing enzyme)
MMSAGSWLRVLGGGGAFPTAERGCGGYLVEHEGFTILIDPGHGTMPRLEQEQVPVEQVDAVVVTHGHGDHCADLNPLLRARHLAETTLPPLPVYAPLGALDPLLELDGQMLADDWAVHDLVPKRDVQIGPVAVNPVELPHFVRNLALRMRVGDAVLAYTGDSGTSPAAFELARDAYVLLAEASFVDEVPSESAIGLSSARERGAIAEASGVGRLVLCHLWSGQDPSALEAAGRSTYSGDVLTARPGLGLSL